MRRSGVPAPRTGDEEFLPVAHQCPEAEPQQNPPQIDKRDAGVRRELGVRGERADAAAFARQRRDAFKPVGT